MPPRQAESKHLLPLLEFIRYLRNLGTCGRRRLPKRVNGTSKLSRLSFPKLSFSMRAESHEEESPMPENNFSGGITQSIRSETESTSLPILFSEDRGKEIQPLKRARNKEEPGDFVLYESSSLPMEYELISRGTQKGVYLAKFVDVDLSIFGLTPLMNTITDKVDRKLAKIVMGRKCCYLLLGTSLIVMGIVVDVDIREGKMQVSPNRGMEIGVDWIEIHRLYKIPSDLEFVQHSVTRHIKKIMDDALADSKS